MHNLLSLIKRSLNRNHSAKGQGLVEYALILGFVALTVFAIVNVMEVSIEEVFSKIVGSAPVAPPSLLSYTPAPTYTPVPTVDPAATNTPTATPTDPVNPPTETPQSPTATHTPTATSTPACTGYAGYSLPGRVQMENFICGRSAVAFADSTGDGGPGSGIYRSDVSTEGPDLAAANGGYYMGWFTTSEWVKYDVNVSTSQVYDITFRAASNNSNGKFRLELINNGQVIHTTSSINVPNSGGTQTWTNVTISGVPFVQGSNQINVIVENGGFNLDYFEAVQAVVSPSCYTLTTAVSPANSGTVSISTAPNCNGTQYTQNTVVYFTANPDTGYKFSNWSGNASGTNASTSVMMDGDKSVTAAFSPLCYTLTTAVSPANSGTVSVSPEPNCGDSQYTYGTDVTLTAQPASTYAFSEWTGDADCSDGNVTINSDVNCTAVLVQTIEELINADFNSNTDGFTYVENAFLDTDDKYNVGEYATTYGFESESGGVRITLGNKKSGKANSGGYKDSFVLSNASSVTVEFDYRLDNNNIETDDDECSQVMVTINDSTDTEVVNKVVMSHCGTHDTGWSPSFSFDTESLTAGTYTITLGGYLNHTDSNANNENAMIYLDNVLVKTNSN